MDDNELTIYILQQLRQGVPEQSIRTILVQNGWPQHLVDRAFSMVQQAAPHNIPPAGYTQENQQTYANPAVANLPAPAENPFPAVEEEIQKEKAAKKGGALRAVLVAVLIVVLLAAASFAGYFIYKTVKNHSSKSDEATTSQAPSKAEQDNQRKKDIDMLADKLMSYYSSKHTYPTLADMNSESFAAAKNGFDISKSKDPSWDSKKTECTDKKGRVVLADGRTAGCYSYRATAMNGGDCDANDTKCTRVVLTANLSNNKPYIVVLDQNVKE